jgi:rhodanese-related sulfurtransferase
LVQTAPRISVATLDELLTRDAVTLVDIRNPGEREFGVIPDAVPIPLAQLRARLDQVPAGKPIVVHCAGGWRSSVAASLLRAQGFENVTDLLGGYNMWAESHVPA